MITSEMFRRLNDLRNDYPLPLCGLLSMEVRAACRDIPLDAFPGGKRNDKNKDVDYFGTGLYSKWADVLREPEYVGKQHNRLPLRLRTYPTTDFGSVRKNCD